MFHFIGDAGIDYYKVENEKLLGGCSLNCATHFKRNSKAQASLYFPTISNNKKLSSHLKNEGIFSHPFKRDGDYPRQDIEILDTGEKNFTHYHPGVLEDFQFTENEFNMISKIDGPIICPLYEQIMPIINQVIRANKKAKYIFDFQDANDFNHEFERILPYLKIADLSQFGLKKEDTLLKRKIHQFASKYKKNLIITQGASEIIFYDKGDQSIVYPEEMVEAVVDSTGAGDAFLGSFLAFSCEHSMKVAIEKASSYAATIILKKGSI